MLLLMALSYMCFDYLADSDTILPVEVQFMIDGDFPFYEMRQQVLESQWSTPAAEIL